MAETSTSSWSDIPLDLAGLILGRLPAHVDRVRFAAVCPRWRLAAREVPLPPSLPLLALPDGTVYSLPGSEPFQLPACAGYTDVSGNWLVFSGEDGCFLRDPFSNETVTVPPLSRVRVRYVADELGSGSAQMETQNVEDLSLLQVQAPRRRVGGQPVVETDITWKEMEDAPEQLTMYKLLYCSPQLIVSFVKFQRSTRVAVCRPGSSWWSVHMEHQFPMRIDIVFHQGKLYILDCFNDALFAIDICTDHTTGDPWVSRVQRATQILLPLSIPFHVIGETAIRKALYLVELNGALLMVRRNIHCKFMSFSRELGRVTVVPTAPTGVNEFEVFKADFERSQWTKVTTIGDDQVLFLRRRCSRFVSVSQNEMPGDSIVFLENDEDHLWRDENSDTCRVYDMKSGNVSTGPPMCSWKRGLVPATWLFPET